MGDPVSVAFLKGHNTKTFLKTGCSFTNCVTRVESSKLYVHSRGRSSLKLFTKSDFQAQNFSFLIFYNSTEGHPWGLTMLGLTKQW